MLDSTCRRNRLAYLPLWAASAFLVSCGADANGGVVAGGGGMGGSSESFTVVTFNTGTTDGLDHDAPPDDG